MDTEIGARIAVFLSSQATSVDLQTPRQLQHMEKIMKVIIRREKVLQSAKKNIAANEINIACIAKEAGIARKTIYNNPLLRELIIQASGEAGATDSDKSDIRKFKNRINSLEEQIHLLVIHDIEMQELKHYNEELRKECLEKDIRIKNLEKDYMKALSELKKYRK